MSGSAQEVLVVSQRQERALVASIKRAEDLGRKTSVLKTQLASVREEIRSTKRYLGVGRTASVGPVLTKK